MPHLFIILLKINLVLLLFAATYYLVLRRLTFYMLNRCFLVFGILFSSIYPFINLTEFFHQQQVNQSVAIYIPQLNEKAAELVPTGFFMNNWPVLSFLFYLGVLLMALRLIIQFISLYKIHRRSEPGVVGNYQVRVLKERVSPFSFWQTVYVNPSLHQDKELNTILAHEMVHVKQWHSLDIILAELSVVFYWFNPGVWIMKRAVKENLEFITDQKILKKGMDRKAYQYSLLDVGNLTPSVAIVNNFNLSDLKKRIKMMNVKRSSRLTLGRYLFFLPFLLVITLAFTISKKDIKTHLPQLSDILVKNEQPEITNDKPVIQPKIKKVLYQVRQQTVDKLDSVSALKHLMNVVFVKKDSLGGELLEPSIREMLGTFKPNTEGSIKVKMNHVFIKKDSASADKISERIKQLREVLKEGGDTFTIQEDDKAKPKIVLVRAVFNASKKADTTGLARKVSYVVNGKVVSELEWSKFDPNDIKEVKVRKITEGIGEIHIVAKKKEETQ